MGAERLIAAQKGAEKIAVEIKTFGNSSFITALYEAVGKYIVYRNMLEILNSDRTLYLAVPNAIYEHFFEESILKKIMEDEKLYLLIYDIHSTCPKIKIDTDNQLVITVLKNE